ncbi:hypothetical protein PAMP_012163 [Pampus punctatissimus]
MKEKARKSEMKEVNEYVFMVQARGIQIRENVKNIGAQVLEQVVRGAYSINGTDYSYDFNMSESDAPPTEYLPEGFTLLPSQVAILVPFRNRHEHLPILLRHLVPVLQKQRLQFGFYVVQQGGTEPFNRAMLFNVGYKEAMKDLDWDCLVFHDVDHLMENDRNYYGCTDMPRHFAVKLDKYSYMVRFAGYTVSRPYREQGRYMSIPHHHHGEAQFLGRYSLLRHSKERQKVDGLNNLNYSPLVSRRPLYTNITVSLSRMLAPVADY